MNESVIPGPVCENTPIREATCVHTSTPAELTPLPRHRKAAMLRPQTGQAWRPCVFSHQSAHCNFP